MNETTSVSEALTQVYQQMFGFIVDFVPRLATGLLVLIVGILIAKIISWAVRNTLSRLKFDAAMERVGVTDMMRSIGVSGWLSDLIGKFLYYLLVVLFVRGAAQSVGLLAVSEAIDSFFAYLPQIVAALLILLLGNLVAQFARTMVEQSGQESGIDYASALGRAVSGGITFVVAIMAISQLGIDTEMIRIVVIAFLAAAAGAFALSFGLGSRDVTRNIVAGFYVRKLFPVGETIEINNEKRVVAAVTPTKTVLENDTSTLAVANAKLLEEDVKQ